METADAMASAVRFSRRALRALWTRELNRAQIVPPVPASRTSLEIKRRTGIDATRQCGAAGA